MSSLLVLTATHHQEGLMGRLTKRPRRRSAAKPDNRPECCKASTAQFRMARNRELYEPDKGKHPLLEQARKCRYCNVRLCFLCR